MSNRDRREALRGAEEETFDLLAQVLPSEQWAGLLRAPLELAVAKGNRFLAQKLVGAGADVGNALHVAARGGHEDIVNDLLENGASVAAKDTSGYGRTPLHDAAAEGGTEIVQLLLLKGADKDALDNDECTPLYMTAIFGRVAAALVLLAAGADISLRCGPVKESVVHVAARRGHVEIMRAAIQRGADVDAVDLNHGTSLHYAAHAAPHNKVEAIDVLVEAGANIEARDRYGCTPLHCAAVQLSLKALLALLKHGAHINAKNEHAQTPLHFAAAMTGRQGTAEAVDSLLRSGADETILDERHGETAADLAGKVFAEEQILAPEDVARVRELLANAPADRAWRHRGYLMLCRAHPDRMRQMHESSNEDAGATRSTGSSAELVRTEAGSCTGTAGGSMVDGRHGGNWAVVVARVLELQEEGIFQTIVGYF